MGGGETECVNKITIALVKQNLTKQQKLGENEDYDESNDNGNAVDADADKDEQGDKEEKREGVFTCDNLNIIKHSRFFVTLHN